MRDPFDDLTERGRVLARSGAWTEVVSLLEPALAMLVRSGELCLLYAEALLRVGRERQACEWLRGAIPILVDAGDRVNHPRALNLLGAAAFALGELTEASEAFTTALEMASQQEDFLLLARATNNLGMIANLRGEHDTALGHYRLAIPTYQRLGQRRGLAESFHNIAITCRDMGALEEADEYECRAIEYSAQGVAPRVAAMGLIGRAEIALRRGDPQFARGTAERAASELQRLHDPLNEADAHRLSGTAANALARFDEAEAAFDRALSIARARGHVLVEAETLRDRAMSLLGQGLHHRAHRDATAAMEVYSRLGASAEVVALQRLFPPTTETHLSSP